MERVGIFFKLKEGKKQEYIKRHDEIWPEVTEVLDVAGIRNYTIWNEEDMLFAYYETKDKQRTERILAQSEIFSKWRHEMEEYVHIEPITGQKEWFMKCVFMHE